MKMYYYLLQKGFMKFMQENFVPEYIVMLYNLTAPQTSCCLWSAVRAPTERCSSSGVGWMSRGRTPGRRQRGHGCRCSRGHGLGGSTSRKAQLPVRVCERAAGGWCWHRSGQGQTVRSARAQVKLQAQAAILS